MRQASNRTISNIIAVLVIFTALLLIGCGDDKKESKDKIEKDAVESQESLETGFEIETPYCMLYYPEKWKEQVRIEKVGGDVFKVEFYGQVEGKEEQHLFDLLLGGTEGYTLGYLATKDENKVAINIISYSLELGEDWQNAEVNTIYAMQEDVNYTIDKLEELDEFEVNLEN